MRFQVNPQDSHLENFALAMPLTMQPMHNRSQGCEVQCIMSRVSARQCQQTAHRASRHGCRQHIVSCRANAVEPSDRSLQERVASFAMAVAAAAAVSMPMAAPPQLMPPAEARALLARDPVKNARALLRNALPINNKAARQIQASLEGISDSLRIPGNKSLGPIASAVRRAENIFGKEKQKMITDFAPDKKEEGLQAIADLENSFKEFDRVLETGDKQAVPIRQQDALGYVGQIEEAMVKEFPYQVPSEYDYLPQLKGRATMEMKLTLAEARENGVKSGLIKIVADGYNAPVTAGNFVDLVTKNFYDGMDIQRADGFVVQTGKPADGDDYLDPNTKQPRKIPFELKMVNDKVPIYEETLEDVGRVNEDPALPFNAFGTLALARQEFDANSGSSQIFFLLKESELTPTGANLLDGRYAVFGYAVEGADLLQELQTGDKIDYIKVTQGLQYLQQPKAGAKPAALGDTA